MFRSPIFLRSILVIGALAGCSAVRDVPWSKAGVNDQQRLADFDECQTETRHATQRSYAIDTDIAATHSQDWHNSGIYNRENTALTAGAAEQTDNLIASCMALKGYRRVPG